MIELARDDEGSPSGPRDLLDLVPGAIAAFGLRRLRAPVGGDGPGAIIRLRRDSGGDEESFATLADGTLDLPGVVGFLGGRGGVCAAWYDQSGCGHHAEAIAAAGPAFEALPPDRRPMFGFRMPARLRSPATLEGLPEFSIFAVFRAASVAEATSVARWQKDGNFVVFPYHTGEVLVGHHNGPIDRIAAGMAPGRLDVHGMVWRQGAADGFATYRNGSMVMRRAARDTAITVGNEPLFIGSFAGLSEHFTGDLVELVVWPRALTDDEVRTVSENMREAAAAAGQALVTVAADPDGNRAAEAALTRRIEFIRNISNPEIEVMGLDRITTDVAPELRASRLVGKIEKIRGLTNEVAARMGMDRVTDEINDILCDPLFADWPPDQQLPMINRIREIFHGPPHASGVLLIPGVERLFQRALATDAGPIGALCPFYDLLFFLYWYMASDWEAMRPFGDRVVVPFAAAIRRGAPSLALPPVAQRPLGGQPLRLGYLAMFATELLGNTIARAGRYLLGSLSRHFPGTYQLVLYPWLYHDEEFLAAREAEGILIRQIPASITVYDPIDVRIAAIAQAIAADGIDILITDMNTSLPTVLFERRAAPIQIFYQLGFAFWPLANLDAVFRMEHYDPELDGFASGKCFSVGLGPWELAVLAPDVDPERIAAERARFPQGVRLIGNYGRFAKITPDFLALAAELLARYPDLVIGLGGDGDETRIRRFIAAQGLTGRLELVGGHVDGHVWGHLIEVFLDTFPHEAGYAGREVMAKGRPVVALRSPWAEHERVPMLVADDHASYLAIVSRLLDDPDFYAAACGATRDFVASGAREEDYAATVHDALSQIVRRVREEAPTPGRKPGRALTAYPVALDQLVCGSVLDELRISAPARISRVEFGAGAYPIEVASVEDVVYLPDLHTQIRHGHFIPSEANTDPSAVEELQNWIISERASGTGSLVKIEEIDEDVCVLSNVYSHNFYHAIEELYKVLILERHGFSGRYVLSTHGSYLAKNLPNFAIDLLDMMAIDRRRILHCSVPTGFRSTYFTTRIGHEDTFDVPGVLFALRAALLAAAPKEGPGLGPRLWLERSTTRGLVNRQEVYEVLDRYGFTAIDMSELPVGAQIAAARDADVISGPHGAAFIHSMFMKERSTVIECFSPEYINPSVTAACFRLKHRYRQLVQSHTTNHKYPHGRDVEVNCALLELAFQELGVP